MKYCKLHNQKYMDFLHECPICVGERTSAKGTKQIKTKPKIKLGKRKPTQVKLF